jgi:hypothetical protein
MEETIEVACECLKKDMARLLSRLKKMRMNTKATRTAADYADDELNVFHNIRSTNIFRRRAGRVNDMNVGATCQRFPRQRPGVPAGAERWSAYCEPKTSANIVQLHDFLDETQLDQRMQSIDRGLAALHRNK